MSEQKAILESIRNIIAGEDEVLDLTEKVNDDGSITKIELVKSALPENTGPAPLKVTIVEETTDVLGEIDATVAENKVETMEIKPREEAPKPVAAKNVELELVDPPKPAPVKEEPKTEEQPKEGNIMSNEPILSPDSANAAKSSISNLMEKVREANEPQIDPGALFRSGETVEKLVMEMLKPMLKEWMDANLTKLVESIVQKEIQKLTSA